MKFPELESSTVELKREIPSNDQIIKTIIGFCNQNGGKLIIGVADNGTVIGVDEDKAQQILEYVEKSIYEASAPPIIPTVYMQRFGDKLTVIIKVSSGMNKPYFLKSEGLERGTYLRLGRSTVRANSDMIEELKCQSRGRSFDTLPVYHATTNDLNMQAFQDFLDHRPRAKAVKCSAELLRSYYVTTQEHAQEYPTIAGILLFGTDPQHFLPETMILCTHFSAIPGRKIIATKDCTGTLFNQFETASDFIWQNLTHAAVIKTKKRVEMLEIPPKAIREILLNAIVHRNYNIKGPIKVAIYADRLEIFSPGTFPGPINPTNLLQGLTYIRNAAISKVFRDAGYVEKLGSGFITVFESYRKQGLPEPHVIEGENFVKCILPRPTVETKKQFIALLNKENEPDTQDILSLFTTTSEVTIKDVMELKHLPRATAGRRLSLLKKRKVITQVGKGRTARYVMKKD